MNHSELIKKMYAIDQGRYKKLIEIFDIKSICFDCCLFNKVAKDGYKCGCPPHCIGATLRPNLSSYLLWQIGVITEDQHHKNLGIGKYDKDRIVKTWEKKEVNPLVRIVDANTPEHIVKEQEQIDKYMITRIMEEVKKREI